MDKLIQTDKGVTISNDGATIMKLLDIVHPAAKVLVDIAQSQDAEVLNLILTFFRISYFILLSTQVGDGTTSVVLLAGSFLNEAKVFIEEDLHPQVIIKAYRSACNLVSNHRACKFVLTLVVDSVLKRSRSCK